jgi:hypothetical protein
MLDLFYEVVNPFHKKNQAALLPNAQPFFQTFTNSQQHHPKPNNHSGEQKSGRKKYPLLILILKIPKMHSRLSETTGRGRSTAADKSPCAGKAQRRS